MFLGAVFFALSFSDVINNEIDDNMNSERRLTIQLLYKISMKLNKRVREEGRMLRRGEGVIQHVRI